MPLVKNTAPSHLNQGIKLTIWILAILALSAIVIVSILRDRIVNPPQWQINVIGQGKVNYQPDTAIVSVGVQVDKVEKADEALKQLNEKINKIYQEVQKVGIPKDDVTTQNYSLYHQYDVIDNVSKLTGYSANQTLLVKVREIQNEEAVNRVVSAVTNAGANQINGISFEASNLNNLKQEARLKAIADARSKAGSIAGALGVRLGKVIGWWENVVYSPETPIYAKGDMAGLGGGSVGGPVIPNGSQELIMEVNVNYRIK